jgi:hypothetical protein
MSFKILEEFATVPYAYQINLLRVHDARLPGVLRYLRAEVE